MGFTMTPLEIAAVQNVLDKWKGAVVHVWSYFVAHRRLMLRLQQPGDRNTAHIVCTDCSYLQGKLVWPRAALAFERLATHEPYTKYVLHDEVGQFRAVFAHAAVEFDLAPMYMA
jgi:hypothetical protein